MPRRDKIAPQRVGVETRTLASGFGVQASAVSPGAVARLEADYAAAIEGVGRGPSGVAVVGLHET